MGSHACYNPQNGVAPIHSAVYLGFDHVVELLINHGAQVDLKMKVSEVIE